MVDCVEIHRQISLYDMHMLMDSVIADNALYPLEAQKPTNSIGNSEPMYIYAQVIKIICFSNSV